MNLRELETSLGLKPLTARSVALSALLGTHPPRLPVRTLVAFGELFGFAEGTVRTALSRMLSSGEVEADDGWYVLGERLRTRQAAQDARRRAPAPWDGRWWVVIADGSGRTLAERRTFRQQMQVHRLGELRPDIWMRPANTELSPSGPGMLICHGAIDDQDPVELVARLWPLDEIATSARSLLEAAREVLSDSGTQNLQGLPRLFVTSIAVVRFLFDEPQLPEALVDDDWPVEPLRTAYDDLVDRHAMLMRSFLSAATDR